VITENMDMDNNTSKKNKLYKSFGYAFEGIGNTILHERNMQIHCTVTVLVVIFGFFLHISLVEWLFCIVLFGLVLSLELVNTALEAVVDLVTQERKPLAKKAKDAAAGAVLMSAIMAAIIGGIIFFPKLWVLIF
jgi:diacylglycerol kinase (ATP)